MPPHISRFRLIGRNVSHLNLLQILEDSGCRSGVPPEYWTTDMLGFPQLEEDNGGWVKSFH